MGTKEWEEEPRQGERGEEVGLEDTSCECFIGFLNTFHRRRPSIVEEDVNVPKDPPGFLSLPFQDLDTGGDVQVEQGDGVRFEFPEALLDIATGGNDLVAARDDLIDGGTTDSRSCASDEPDEGSHFEWFIVIVG